MSAKKPIEMPFKDHGEFDPDISVEQVNHPPHYTWANGVEAIDITENFNFNLGNAIKYIWRCDYKGSAITDLKKAIFYLNREIARRESKK